MPGLAARRLLSRGSSSRTELASLSTRGSDAPSCTAAPCPPLPGAMPPRATLSLSREPGGPGRAAVRLLLSSEAAVPMCAGPPGQDCRFGGGAAVSTSAPARRPTRARDGPRLGRSHSGESGRVAPCFPRKVGAGRGRAWMPAVREMRSRRSSVPSLAELRDRRLSSRRLGSEGLSLHSVEFSTWPVVVSTTRAIFSSGAVGSVVIQRHQQLPREIPILAGAR
jgi:hypothetical protein